MASLSAEVLNPDRLKQAAGKTIFERGAQYYHEGRVKIEEVGGERAVCKVRGSRPYTVEIKVANNYLLLNCDCDYAARGVVCKHDVAAALAVRERLHQKPRPPRWKAQVSKLLQTAQAAPRRGNLHLYLLFFSLIESSNPALTSWKLMPYQIPLSAIPKDLRSDEHGLEGASLGQMIEKYPQLAGEVKSPYHALNPSGCLNCTQASVVLANSLLERSRASYYYAPFPIQEYLALIAQTHSPLFLGNESMPLRKPLELISSQGTIGLEISREAKGIRLTAQMNFPEKSLALKKDDLKVICNAPLWVMTDRYLFQVQDEPRGELLPLLIESPEMFIPATDQEEFLETFYLPLAEQISVRGDAVSWEVTEATQPKPRVYLMEQSGELRAELRFAYGEYEVAYDTRFPRESVARKPESWTLVRLRRLSSVEEGIFKSLSSSHYNLKRTPPPAAAGTFSLRARTHPVDFLLHSLPRLVEDGFEIFGEEALKSARVNRSMPKLSLQVSSGIDWFDVRAVVQFGDLEVAFKDIRRVLRKKERFVKLADGTIGEIPADWIERYKHLFALGEEVSLVNGEAIRLRSYHVTLLEELLSGADQQKADEEFKVRRQRLRDFSGIAGKPMPAGFTGELRPYQKAGYDWLHFLNEFEFGGCLADDMGLGKTVQVLAFFQSLKECLGTGGAPQHASLVVVPRSLLVNWQREAARFTPNLRLLVYFDKDRIKDTNTFDEYDLVLTTYGVMLRDIQVLHGYMFQHILLDESQMIKNPAAQTGRAARLLQGHRRLVLTGTPVENSTLELWSQFAFLNPGLLGNLEYFREEFSNPIEKKGDEKAAQFLRRMIFPFILRRTKDQVAPELPPRTERILYCDMEPAQRKLYNRTRDYFRNLLLGMIEKGGINNSRLKILEGLLRLRQIANHPRLADEHYHGESGKFELLCATLETLRFENHKALVFSQFVQMLRLVRGTLDEGHVPYTYLDGHTRNRQEQVDIFQEKAEIPFFLISLRAGGLGLNLTAADYVIHIDPWWNPAVEMQATDRTHRIGQDKPVFVYKLITRDSVEEKILQLQERKKNLVDQLITTENSFVKSLTIEDVEILFGK